MSRCLAIALAVLFAVTAAGDTAGRQAEEHAQLGIRPIGVDGAYFTLMLEPGDRQTLEVEIGNYGTREGRARTYAADVYTLVNGGLGVEEEDEPTSGPTTWLDYEGETYELDPGKGIRREFALEVPDDAAPGEYLTSLVIQPADAPALPAGDDQGVGLTIIPVVRQAVSVAITVPGPRRPGLAIGEAVYRPLPGTQTVLVAVENTGNAHLRPSGELVVVDATGAEVFRAAFAMGAIWAGTPTFVELALPAPLAPGDYAVSLSLADAVEALSVSSGPLPLHVADPEPAPAPEPVPIAIAAATVADVRDGASGALQYVEVAVRIDNAGFPVANARLTVHVLRDGAPVEDFVLGASLFLPDGPTELRQRYLPAGGWQAGTYTFAVTLELVDPATGAATVIAQAEADRSVTAP